MTMKIADPNPVYCSCCFQQQPAMIHVDFQVAWDGPVINTDGLRVPIDDLYLCQLCLEGAGKVLEKELKARAEKKLGVEKEEKSAA